MRFLFGGVKSTCGQWTVGPALCDVVDVRIERIKTHGGLEPVMRGTKCGGLRPVAIDRNQVVDQLLAPFFRDDQYQLGMLLNEGAWQLRKIGAGNQISRDSGRPTRLGLRRLSERLSRVLLYLS
jgi:hypothetical protein